MEKHHNEFLNNWIGMICPGRIDNVSRIMFFAKRFERYREYPRNHGQVMSRGSNYVLSNDVDYLNMIAVEN